MYKNHQSYVPFESPSTKFGMRSRVLSDSKVIQSEAKNYFLSSNKSKNSTSRGINGTIQNSNSNITTSGRTSTYNGSNNRDDSQGTDSERHRSTETNGSVSKYNYSQLVDYPRRRLFDEEINAHHIKISNPLKSDGESEGDNKLDESHTLSDSKRRPSLSRGMRRFGALFVMGIGLNSSSASRKTLGSDSDEVHR